MSFTSETIEIEGIKVRIATGTRNGNDGETQTINVYDNIDTEGNYREVYRITGSENFLTIAEIRQGAATLKQLDVFLRGKGAVPEGGRH
jgi:hypothetical protein